MKVAYENSLAYRVEQRIEAIQGNVILRSDLSDLGDSRQLTYALKKLIQDKKIVRVSSGIYSKLEIFEWQGKEITVLKSPGFTVMVRETLDRLNIPWQPSRAEEEYNSGRSTQVPARFILRLKSRFRRKIAYAGMVFKYEKVA